MKAYEKEIIEAQIKSEKAVIKQLKDLYSESLKQIDDKIKALTARYNAEELQSVIYQLDYQRALKKEISGILDVLQAGEYEKISDYLNSCYKDGFMGTMYSIQKQGIPLITPIDQEQVINAIVHKSKISEGLYKRLGVNTSDLKKRISAEVSRGLANNMSYADITRNLAKTSSIGINNSIRIARTEGHRIQAQAQLDAAHKAKDKGADVVKQWDSSLDKRVRKTHAQLDGQIRELDEPFEVNGKQTQAPSQFGVPSEDINCRCAMLERARWALDEEELEELKKRAEYYGLDKTESFEDYKKKYLKAVEEEAKEVIEKPNKPTITLDNFPSEFKANTKKTKNSQLLSDFINKQEQANPRVVELYSKLDNLEIGGDIPFEVGFGQNNAVTTWATYSGKVTKQKITLQDLTKNDSLGAYQTNLHELGHLIDSNVKDKGRYYSASFKNYKEVLKNSAEGMSDEVKELFEETKKKYRAITDEYTELAKKTCGQITQDYRNGVYKTYSDYKKAWNKAYKEATDAADIAKRNLGINNFQDIYDALSGGVYRDMGVVQYGHGTKYFRDYSNRIEEIFANYMSLSVTNPELIEMLRRDKPELVDLLDDMVEEMLKGVK